MKQFKFDINGSKYEVDVKSLEDNLAEVEVNGNLYQVKIDDGSGTAPSVPTVKPVVKPAAAPAAAAVTAPAAAGTKGSKSIKAPLPGSILKINVAAGTAFMEGDVLMVMESMKMENNIQAESNGTVTKLCTSVGAAVMQDDVLIEYN
ncbi:MAG: acetyl-CoA carboxylase biotin carboxyl carrier protein subunit [Prevotellaceae bacterium]|jgi:biotin carboxyl carrier protein|nr:acetyl-CoA carboxylase biotin carboxyl carrier protein subunit [Prevotellaceae bacterium]